MKTSISSLLLFFCFALSAQVINTHTRRISVDSTGLYGNVNLNFAIRKTTKNLISISKGGQLTYVSPTYRLLLFGNYSLVKAEGESFSNNGFGHLRYNRKISKLIEWEAFTQSQFNSLTKIDQRWLNGTGFRFQLTELEDALALWGIAYMLEYEKTQGVENDFFANRLSSYFHFLLAPYKEISFESSTYVQPRLSQWSDYRILNENQLKLVINNRLSLSISFNFLYDSEPPSEVPNLTFDFLNGLVYSFGK